MPRLTTDKRDELLIRLDEKMKYTCELTEKQESHLAKLNDRTRKSEMNIDRNHNRLTTIENILTTGMPLRLNKKQMAGSGASLVTLLVLVITAVGKIIGWW